MDLSSVFACMNGLCSQHTMEWTTGVDDSPFEIQKFNCILCSHITPHFLHVSCNPPSDICTQITNASTKPTLLHKNEWHAIWSSYDMAG
jgi:hypothetical protein